MSINQIIFDLGAVLIDWQPEVIAKTAFRDPARQKIALEEVLKGEIWSRLDRGTISEAEAAVQIADRCSIEPESLCHLFEVVRACLIAKQESLAILHGLAKKKYPLFCLSNISSINLDYLQSRNEFFSLFSGILISADVQLLKPEPAIYHALLSRFNLKAIESLFIDDSHLNTAAAEQLGIQTIWFQNATQCRQALVRLGL